MIAALASWPSLPHDALAQEILPFLPTSGWWTESSPDGADEAGDDVTEATSTDRLFGQLLRPECGIDLEPVYYGEIFSNTKGGINTNRATRYEGLLDLSLTLDFEKMDMPLPGRFFVLAQNTHGQGLTKNFVGDTQFVSNIDSFDNIMQVSEYWWECRLFDDRLVVRLGKQDVNTEFLVMDLAGDFVHSSPGLSPSSAFPSYPDPSMAAVLLANLAKSTTLKIGIWDLLADGGSWGFSGNDVTILFGELEYQFTLDDGRLPGALDLGIAYLSGGRVSPRESFPSAYGYYLQIEQLLFRENPYSKQDSQGLGVVFSYFPRFPNGPIPVSAIIEDVVGGVVYRGLIPGRDEDVVGAGFAWAELDQGGTNEEIAFEVFYKAQVTPWMSVQPDFQYIKTPSGIYPDALVVGLRATVAL
jgi:porin